MNLLDITYYFNRTCFQQDAVLLSMLPYCITNYNSLGLLFNGRSERWTCTSRLENKGLIESKKLKVQSSFRSYDYKYLVITKAGLQYLASVYGELYPWLKYLHDNDLDLVRPRASFSNRSLHGLLRRQSTSLFWAMAGAETIYSRMSTHPDTVGDSLYYLSNSDLWTPYSLAYLMKEHPAPSAHLTERPSCTFYDSMEALSITDPIMGSSLKDNALFKSNHTGLLVDGSNQKYMVFTSTQHGIKWSSTPVVKSIPQLRVEFGAIRPGIDTSIPSGGLHAFLICRDANEMRHCFTNNRRQWAKRTRYLGQGTSSLHMLPYNDDGIALAQGILSTPRYNTNLCYQLSLSNPGVTYDGLNLRTPLSYKGESCVPCFDMDAHMFLHAKEQIESSGRTTIICWDWQVPYVQSLLPDVKVYSVSSTTGEIGLSTAIG